MKTEDTGRSPCRYEWSSDMNQCLCNYTAYYNVNTYHQSCCGYCRFVTITFPSGSPTGKVTDDHSLGGSCTTTLVRSVPDHIERLEGAERSNCPDAPPL